MVSTAAEVSPKHLELLVEGWRVWAMRHSSYKMCLKGHHVTMGRCSLLGLSAVPSLSSCCRAALRGWLLPVMQCLYPPLLAIQQPQSRCRQKPRRPSCPDKPEMGVGQAQSISSAIPKGHTATNAKGENRANLSGGQ